MACSFKSILPEDSGEVASIILSDIPFSPVPSESGSKNLLPGRYSVESTFGRMCFLGMTADRMNDRDLFIGDLIGKIEINYTDDTRDVFPIIFGVNCWPRKAFEAFPEPFASDAAAKALLDESLILTGSGENCIFTITPCDKKIESVELSGDASLIVTAITGADGSCDDIVGYDAGYFLRRDYYPAMDKLARRLYAFSDELPESVGFELPRGYKGPKVRFTGNRLADILTEVYSHNIWDMATDKLDSRANVHASSRKAPDFGDEAAFGTYRADAGVRYDQMITHNAGRMLSEVVEWGECERAAKAAEKWLKSSPESADDGHAAMMLFIYRLYQRRCVDRGWLRNLWTSVAKTAEVFCRQVESCDKVLNFGGELSLFSNTSAYYALRAFGIMAAEMGRTSDAKRWGKFAERLWDGINEVFTTTHPRHEQVFVDSVLGRWSEKYDRFAPILLASDVSSYDLSREDAQLFEQCRCTYRAQKEDYFDFNSAANMGCGQGYLSQAAILLDDYDDLTKCVEQAASFCWHPHDHSWMVPQSVASHQSGRFWFRKGDLGSSLDQAEIVKCARLLIGLDDLKPETGLSIVPRIPDGWESIQVRDYPIVTSVGGAVSRIEFEYSIKRIKEGYTVALRSEKPIDYIKMRIGPFPWKTKNIRVRMPKAQTRIAAIGSRQFIYLDLKNTKAAKFEVVAV